MLQLVLRTLVMKLCERIITTLLEDKTIALRLKPSLLYNR